MAPGQHEEIRKSWAVPLTGKCTLFHGHCAALVSSQYHYQGWQLDLSQQAGCFILLSTQLQFNQSARLEEGPLSPDLWNGDICGPDKSLYSKASSLWSLVWPPPSSCHLLYPPVFHREHFIGAKAINHPNYNNSQKNRIIFLFTRHKSTIGPM